MIYITGDTHGDIDIKRLFSRNWNSGKHLDKSDYLIITGDFGLIWDINDSQKTEKYWLDWLTNKPWTTLFIDGNHENFDRLNDFPEVKMFGDKVGRITDSIFHLKRGRIYTINEKKFFTFGGANSYDKISRIEYISWWRQEIPNYSEFNLAFDNLEKHDFKVDYVISHTAPNYAIHQISQQTGMEINQYQKDPTVGMLDNFVTKLDYKYWFFGHFHIDHTVNKRMTACYQKIHRVV